MRAALEALPRRPRTGSQACLAPGWNRRYRARVESYRLPGSASARAELAVAIGRDGYLLLEAVGAQDWLRQVRAVDVLRTVWVQQYRRTENTDGGTEVNWPGGPGPPAKQTPAGACHGDGRVARGDLAPRFPQIPA